MLAVTYWKSTAKVEGSLIGILTLSYKLWFFNKILKYFAYNKHRIVFPFF